MSEQPEPPDGTRIEFQEYGSKGGDLIAICRDDASSLEAGWPVGDGGKVWCEYGLSVPITWAEVLADDRLAAAVNGLRLVPAAAAERRGMKRAIQALRDVAMVDDGYSMRDAADFLASLMENQSTEEGRDGDVA